MTVEICCYSLESCLNVEKAGGSRIELCGGQGEGGTTPAAGLIVQVKRRVTIPVYVMIRPRGGDFVYDRLETDVMLDDIHWAKQLGADGLVMGALTPNGEVDVPLMKKLLAAAAPLGVTFHRAFDVARDPENSLEVIIGLGMERVLTSGQKPTAAEGVHLLRKLAKNAKGRIEIMAGGGVNAKNTNALLAAGVNALHLTGKAFRQGRQQYYIDSVRMAEEAPDERAVMFSDPEKIEAVVQQALAFTR